MGYVYWCAACGNPDIIVENAKTGYSMGKGIVGAAVLGPVGAVAGLDGKNTVVYYCPKCGAKLNHCMPDYEVSGILEMLKSPEAFRDSILAKRKKYPNMMLPKGWEMDTADTTIISSRVSDSPDVNYIKRLLQNSEYDFEDKLYDYVKQFKGIPSNLVDDFRVSLYNNQQEYQRFTSSFLSLEDSCKIRLENINGEELYVAAKDNEEIKAWRREAAADKIPIDGYIGFVKGLVKEKPRTVNEIEQEIINKWPDINYDNPYAALSIAKRACKEINQKDGLVDFDGNRIKIKSTKLAEDDLRWKVKDNWNSGLTRERLATVRSMAPILKSRSRVTYQEVAKACPPLTSQKAAAYLKYLCDDGYATKQKVGSDIYVTTSDEVKRWSTTDFENWIIIHTKSGSASMISARKAEALEMLKQNSGKSFWDIIGDGFISRIVELYYESFMILELEGLAHRTETPSEYIWEYIDKNAALREKLENERIQLTKEIEEYKKETDAQLAKNNNLLSELRNRTFDDSEYTAKIADLEKTKSALSERLSKLGIFKFSEKKQVSEEIAKCETALLRTKQDMNSAKVAFDNEIAQMSAAYSGEIDKCNKALSAKIDTLRNIEEKLSKL